MEQLKLSAKILNFLKNKKCLLAFSHGVDSTALFYLLKKENISFDCAFVNYKTRTQSDIEESYAKKLCEKFGKKIFIKTTFLNLKNKSNFEKKARDIRWEFFGFLCNEKKYEVLITAHQLNDRLEWFLMQFLKGSGTVNLLGMQKIEKKDNFIIARPLLDISRNEILNFLHTNQIKYFNDESNLNTEFKRNYIRQKFSNAMINEYAKGILKSFEFLEQDKEILLGEFLYANNEFFIVKNSKTAINLIDKACKILGTSMSEAQRKECLKTDCVISAKICICYTDKYVYVCPYKKNTVMDKKFKERCRILKIPPLIRPYIFTKQELLKLFCSCSA